MHDDDWICACNVEMSAERREIWSASLNKSILEGSTVGLGEASAVFLILSDLSDSLAIVLSFSTTGASSSGNRSAGRSSVCSVLSQG